MNSDNDVTKSEIKNLRDYFAAHAPSEPQSWFQPKMPAKYWAPVPAFTKMHDNTTAEELSALRDYDSDWMCPEDVKEGRVKEYLLERQRLNTLEKEYYQKLEYERLVQWPYAWADAVLKVRNM